MKLTSIVENSIYKRSGGMHASFKVDAENVVRLGFLIISSAKRVSLNIVDITRESRTSESV